MAPHDAQGRSDELPRGMRLAPLSVYWAGVAGKGSRAGSGGTQALPVLRGQGVVAMSMTLVLVLIGGAVLVAVALLAMDRYDRKR